MDRIEAELAEIKKRAEPLLQEMAHKNRLVDQADGIWRWKQSHYHRLRRLALINRQARILRARNEVDQAAEDLRRAEESVAATREIKETLEQEAWETALRLKDHEKNCESIPDRDTLNQEAARIDEEQTDLEEQLLRLQESRRNLGRFALQKLRHDIRQPG